MENYVGYLIWVYEYLLGVTNPLNFPYCVYAWVINHFGFFFWVDSMVGFDVGRN